MKLPLLWLHDYCDPGLPAAELATRLALSGTEVDRVHAHGVGALEHFVVGKVLSAERHPDADRLTVCRVDTGDGAPSQIVCGAPNVAAGQTVAVARPGAVMPDGSRLKRAKLRGQESAGMILAEDEVAIGVEHDGIMVLDDALAAGTPLTEALPIATDVLELEITPNRPDCLGVYGVAREVHAATEAPLAPAPWSDDPHPAGDSIPGFSVEVRAPDLCPRFTARLFEDVRLGPSPAWLKARLMAAGQRPINNVVDITNYVMLLTGQPMHAFDADLVAGGRLVVRRGRAGETMTTLDDVRRTLDPEVCVIDDAEGPTSIAGVMGGARSEVRDEHDARADGGRDLERPEHPAHVDAPGTAHRGVGPLREAAPARAGAGGPGGREQADDRALRRAAGGRDDRRRRPGPGAGHAAPARRAHRAAARSARAARRRGAVPLRARLRRGRGARRARRDGAAVAARRRRARGRPDRGGRAAVGPRPHPGDAAVAPRRGRAAGAGAARAPARGGRAGGRRAVRGGRLELLLARASRAGSGCRATLWCSRTRCPRTTRSCARPCSARCWTRCAATRSRGFEDVRLFEYGAVYHPRSDGAGHRSRTPATRGTRSRIPSCRSSARTSAP